jgi:hypothetical protein
MSRSGERVVPGALDDPEELGAAASELFVDGVVRGHGRGANTNSWTPGDILSRRLEISNTASQEVSLGALVLVMRAEWRRLWRAWIALVSLVAFVSRVVLGSIAGGRRTDSALPSFLAAHGFDAAVYTPKPWPKTLNYPK